MQLWTCIQVEASSGSQGILQHMNRDLAGLQQALNVINDISNGECFVTANLRAAGLATGHRSITYLQ